MAGGGKRGRKKKQCKEMTTLTNPFSDAPAPCPPAGAFAPTDRPHRTRRPVDIPPARLLRRRSLDGHCDSLCPRCPGAGRDFEAAREELARARGEAGAEPLTVLGGGHCCEDVGEGAGDGRGGRERGEAGYLGRVGGEDEVEVAG